MSDIKLNLGCGAKKFPGYLNVDKFGTPDLKHDLESFPWPWETNSVSEIALIHVLEHLGKETEIYFGIFQEMYRVCEDDATIHVHVPSPWHWNFTSDPTHVRPVTPDGLNLFSKEHCQKCIDEGKSETPFAMIYNVDLRPHDVVWKYDQMWENKLYKGEVQQSQMEELHSMYRNVVTEFQIPLAVVKSEETDKKHQYEHNLCLPDGTVPVDAPSNIMRY